LKRAHDHPEERCVIGAVAIVETPVGHPEAGGQALEQVIDAPAAERRPLVVRPGRPAIEMFRQHLDGRLATAPGVEISPEDQGAIAGQRGRERLRLPLARGSRPDPRPAAARPVLQVHVDEPQRQARAGDLEPDRGGDGDPALPFHRELERGQIVQRQRGDDRVAAISGA
jgi:hypothetical protein